MFLFPAIAFILGLHAAADPKPLPPDVKDSAAYASVVLDVNVKVVAQDCGYINAWYEAAKRKVTLCTDLFQDPALTRFVLYHEMAHAYFHQHKVPVWNEEASADELGALLGTTEDQLAGALWFLSQPLQTIPNDEHPSSIDRAAMLVCLLDGLSDKPVDRQCKVYAHQAIGGWLRTLEMTHTIRVTRQRKR